MKKPIILAIGLSLLVIPSTAYGWGNVSTHPEINAKSYESFINNSNIPFTNKKQYKGIGYPDDIQTGEISEYGPLGRFERLKGEIPLEETQEFWIREGGFSADEPEALMGIRHFYDPTFNNESLGFLTDLDIKDGDPSGYSRGVGTNAKQWALKKNIKSLLETNPYSWEYALEYYKAGMETDNLVEKNLYFGKAFRALGQTMHLMADMTQPAHVRNDGHKQGEPIEDNVTDTLVSNIASEPLPNEVNQLLKNISSPSELFDVVSKYTNNNFYSNDTIYNNGSGTKEDPIIYPRNNKKNYPSPYFKQLTLDNDNITYYKYFDNKKVRMVELWMKDDIAREEQIDEIIPTYKVPPEFATDYASVLIPLAIKSNMILLNEFFPKMYINLVPSKENETISAEIIHNADNSGWRKVGQIKYSGKGQIKIDNDVREVEFIKGKMAPISLSNMNWNSISLTVDAGGRFYSKTIANTESGYKLADPVKLTSLEEYLSKPSLRRPFDLIFVIDSSGSMGPGSGDEYNGDLNNNRILATKNIIKSLKYNDRSAIIDFDTSAKLLQDLTSDKEALIKSADRIDSSGGTDVETGLKEAINLANTIPFSDDRNPPLVILLTDGKDNENHIDSYERITDFAKRNNIYVYTVSLGKTPNTGLLNKIANETGGEYFTSSTSEEIEHIFDLICLNRSIKIVSDDNKNNIPDWIEREVRINGYKYQKEQNGVLLEKSESPTDDLLNDCDEKYGKNNWDIFINSNNGIVVKQKNL
ncbi:VWA domain-containing protein [Heliobacillus mobilis]|uniref:VWA domain-containing protein n=1 Tax=Heliobacterium mobile TaxID=28064 RepID=A0A6I3SLJ4_HELMO|nr:VWA domain-containing protein [Heliobacterium mobile]MTV49804.1 VWA domain-containing protein [Heliobacterium mobile]